MPPRSSKRKDDFRLQNTVRLDADGLAKVLGDLEARVMDTEPPRLCRRLGFVSAQAATGVA